MKGDGTFLRTHQELRQTGSVWNQHSAAPEHIQRVLAIRVIDALWIRKSSISGLGTEPWLLRTGNAQTSNAQTKHSSRQANQND